MAGQGVLNCSLQVLAWLWRPVTIGEFLLSSRLELFEYYVVEFGDDIMDFLLSIWTADRSILTLAPVIAL